MATQGNQEQTKAKSNSWLWMGGLTVIALIIGGWFFLAGPGSESVITAPAEAVATESDAAQLPPKPKAGHPAPEFTLAMLDGGQLSLADFAGQPVILNFWASWCGPCRVEMPHLQQAHVDQGDDGVRVVGVNLTKREGSLDDVPAFIDEFGLTFPVVLDEEGDVAQLYEVRGQPASVFIDSEGVVQMVWYGPVNEDFINERIAELTNS